MKNIHVLPTDKPSRLFYNVGGALLFRNYQNHNGVNLYITNDEEITEEDWFTDDNNSLKRSYKLSHVQFANPKKIILTTDQGLIKDGVQSIDDEFLEWFVKNPSCEEVELDIETELDAYYRNGIGGARNIKIIIPKEEPKQETLEEAATNYTIDFATMSAFKLGAKWQQEQILDFLYEEITERRDYSASKMCEVVIDYIKQNK